MAAILNFMPEIQIPLEELRNWGQLWLSTNNPDTGGIKQANCFVRKQSVNFATFIDKAVAESLAKMLGNIPVVAGSAKKLIPSQADCVEMGPARIIGGVRPQNFDVAYRPDGVRIAFDSKTLNDIKSVGKNWQNMVNDLATEAATVHTRFPYAIVAFMVMIPEPALGSKQQADLVRTLERMASRKDVLNQSHLAEAISLVVWNPVDGTISKSIPEENSVLRIEQFSKILYPQYVSRYKGLPPHDEAGDEVENENDEN
ncbi:MAG: hypothetical protein K9J37_01310 [Saprospiraceae bacterium]|nr:hypothetical protein [Saprospiraceae bacterium]MCF8248514.1 hypothetical protein [Saprospiraceae bacterium]MCF8280585.1 hypothetical protein [Bacteroidales bacterium]MCF8310248.1 hypothetical protein [Saprospiraceae bacterium]MCF8439313.1 hypothetical protein [Saprospiraceae bacterium]